MKTLTLAEFQKLRSVPRKTIVKAGESNYDGNLLLKILHELKKHLVEFDCGKSRVEIHFKNDKSSGFFVLWPLKDGVETIQLAVIANL